MPKPKTIPIRESITSQILKVTFAIYFIVTLTVTLIHMRAEYQHIEQCIIEELQAMQETFEPILTQSLWRLDRRQWESTVNGMMRSPILVGAKLQDKKELLFTSGTILNEEGNIISGASAGKPNSPDHESVYTNLLKHHFVMTYAKEQVGEITLYSSNAVVFERVKVGFTFIILNAIIKTLTLWILFFWVGKRLLNRPLSIMTASVKKINLNNLKKSKIDIKTTKRNELKVLETAFNSMISNLSLSIAERKQSEATFREIVEKVPVMIGSFDETGHCTIWNDEATKQLGYTLEALQNSTPPLELMYSKEEAVEVQKRINVKDGIFRVYHPVAKNGNTRTQEWANFSLPDGRSVSIGRDITEKEKMEEQLRQSQKMEAIGTLAGGIAHDFNNILFPIIGLSEIIAMGLPPDHPIRENADTMLKSALRGRDLVQQILTFSRKSKTKIEPIKLHLVIQDTIKLLRSSIPKTIHIEQDLDPNCGWINADTSKIHQIIMNLSTNAYHAMEDTGGRLTISLKQINIEKDHCDYSNLLPGPYARLTVIDTGIGMEKEVKEKIFDPYFTTKESGKGTGLGLPVVHGVVKECGGDIYIYSEPGKGTKVFIFIPVTETGTENEAPEHETDLIMVGTERILIVDDEEEVACTEQQLLERLGYDVTIRIESIEALEEFKANSDKYDLIITDMTMPNMTGIQLAEKIRNIRVDIPIIICTGFSDQLTDDKRQSVNIQGYVMKPVTMREFARTIREVLDVAGPGYEE
ncbi:MAG: response regulator [Deltaproteobacteria bacterium]|nr:response regulator [Deltaproteobacteria bacterium]